MDNNVIEIKVTSLEMVASTDFEAEIFDLEKEIDLLSSQADKWDCLVAVASGILCGMLDIVWVGDFSLENGRAFASDKIDDFVEKTAGILGFKGGELKDAVKFLEDMFPIPSDGNTPDFGGGLQHHLRDFAHHPTIVGLIFSLLTQFTGMSYGTDVKGVFKVVPVPDKSKAFIGNDIPDKLFKGTIVWFFHLVSDMAGSSSTAGITGGTGIPGPILSLAKELSVLPIFQNIKIGENKLSVFLSKLFNGTYFAMHDENGKIIKDTVIKFDLRGELGVIAELGKQALPVLANDCIVRSFYFLRRFSLEMKAMKCSQVGDIQPQSIDWNNVKPFGNPTIDRMLTISSAVFSTVDIAEAVITKKYFVAVNYAGVGRFAIAIGTEISNYLKVRDVKRIKQMYENIRRNTFTDKDNNIYSRIGKGLDLDQFGLTIEQIEILYNLEMYKTINDINLGGKKADLKAQWLNEWKQYMEQGFSSFVGDEKAALHWYTVPKLHEAVLSNDPELPWFRLMLLEVLLFEPYYPLSVDTDQKGNDIPSEKYKGLKQSVSEGDKFLEGFFTESFYKKGYVARLRKCHNKVLRELNEVLKAAIKSISISAGIAIIAIATAGAFAPAIAVALVGSNFAGLSGAALTSACLAYLGGGAIAAGGLGMAGGTMAIVGGGAVLGLGVGAGVGGAIGAADILGKEDTILQSAKLMVSVQEIFLNDEHNLEYSQTVYEQYFQRIVEIEKNLVEPRLKAYIAGKEEKKQLDELIKKGEEVAHAMKLALKNMNKFNSSFAIGELEAKQTAEEECDLPVEVDEKQQAENEIEGTDYFSDANDSKTMNADEQQDRMVEDSILKIKVKDRDIQVLDGYQQLDSTPDTPPDSVIFGTETDTMRCLIMLFPITPDKTMPFRKPKKVIDSIHHSLDDGQGLIEVEAGKTKGGSRFVYSIVKTKLEPFGVQYTLRVHFDHPNGPIEILAFFEEAGSTGLRDAVVFQIARDQKLVDENMNGWMKDPYTPDYKKGLLMNLSEQRKFDQHFPGHPLTELRKYIDAFIGNN